MNNKKLRSVILYTFGLLFFGFTSLVYMISITRINGLEDAGKFSFAFAIACTFFAIGTYIGKTYQITDNSKKIHDKDYIVNKVITCLLMVVITLIYSLIKGFSYDKLLLIMILTVYRGTDAFVEVYHAIIQKKDDIAKVGISIFIRTILLMITFIGSLYLYKNIIISSLAITILNIVYIFIVDYKLCKNNIEKNKMVKQNVINLMKFGLPICLFTFISVYLINASKYAIDFILDDTVQGVYSIILMPATFLSMISLYVTQSFLNEIADYIKNNKYDLLTKLVFKISMFIVVIGILAIACAYLLGIPVLEFIYSVTLEDYKMGLIIILIGSVIYSICCLLSNVFISLRRNNLQLILLLINFAFTIIISPIMVRQFNIDGACYAYLLTMIVQLLLFIIGYIYSIKHAK